MLEILHSIRIARHFAQLPERCPLDLGAKGYEQVRIFSETLPGTRGRGAVGRAVLEATRSLFVTAARNPFSLNDGP
jgi:hypothetical protein